MNKLPEELILKRNSTDYIGAKLVLISDTNGINPVAYYAKMEGSSSIIKTVYTSHMNEIISGKHSELFTTIEQLHNSVEVTLNRCLKNIKRHRETGKYFEQK